MDSESNQNESSEPHTSGIASLRSKKLDSPAARLRWILEHFSQQSNLHARLHYFSILADWTRFEGKTTSIPERIGRLNDLLSLLEEDSDLRARFQKGFHAMLEETDAIGLFAEAGLHPRESMWSETIRRIVERVLPSARSDKDLSKLIFRMYPDDRYVAGFLQWPDELFRRTIRALTPADDSSVWDKQQAELSQAVCLLGTHVAGVGLSPHFRERCHPYPVEDSPFYRVQRFSGEVARAISSDEALSLLATLRNESDRCRSELEFMHERMEETGVSTTLEFDMGTIERGLHRIDCVNNLLFSSGEERVPAVKRLLDDVMRAHLEDLSLSGMVQENSSLLARKIVERTGKTGEHYIANTRAEYWSMWKAAMGGGLLVVGTAVVKMKITLAGLPPFAEGFLVGTNYAVSFLILQALGLALATKQPSMTAATYAKIVRTTQGSERWEKLTELVSRITRTQLAAAMGNLLTVILGAVLLVGAWSYWFSEPYLPPSSSRYIYETLNPLASGTGFYAALTGVILWLSALAGGWVENFAAYNRLAEAIAEHPLGWRIGFARMQRLARIFEHNISGWSSSIVLGYLLGFIPPLGHFFGIPLDVRHVTLSTGTLALAAASLGKDWLYRGWFIHTLFGIAIIFVLNLGVSFGIAARVALRAYQVPYSDQLQLLKYVIKSFFRSPRRFLFPINNVAAGPEP
jgi:site-specific recombinase